MAVSYISYSKVNKKADVSTRALCRRVSFSATEDPKSIEPTISATSLFW